MEMTLDYLATFINDNTVVDIYAECTGTPIATYDGKNSIPYRYMDELVTDIFTDKAAKTSGTVILCLIQTFSSIVNFIMYLLICYTQNHAHFPIPYLCGLYSSSY